MTEQEAKTKWCPFSRERAAQGMPDGGGNRPAYGSSEDGPVEDDYTREAAMLFPCIGSACMAWRWDDVPNPEYAKHQASGMSWYPPTAHPPMYLKSETEGHCGLAGRP